MNYESMVLNGANKAKKNTEKYLETERLTLIPLQTEQLALSLIDYGKMQADLGLNINKEVLDDEDMQYAMEVRLRKVLANSDHYLWYTNWAIVLRGEKLIIGYLILKGFPNELGEVILGYDIDIKYRRKRYATEALNKITEWIFENPQSLSIIADTEKTNIPSCKLLEHIGAVPYKETEDLIWWRISKNLER